MPLRIIPKSNFNRHSAFARQNKNVLHVVLFFHGNQGLKSEIR